VAGVRRAAPVYAAAAGGGAGHALPIKAAEPNKQSCERIPVCPLQRPRAESEHRCWPVLRARALRRGSPAAAAIIGLQILSENQPGAQ